MRSDLAVLGLAILLVGCPDSEGERPEDAAGGAGGAASVATGGGGAAPTPTAEGYCEAIADFFCDFYLRCGRMAVSSVEACRPAFLESCNSRFEPRYLDLEQAGLLSLDAAGLAACEAHLSTVACEQQVLELSSACAAMWRGSQPVGASCGLDVESFVCAPGGACVLGLDLCGACESVVPVGGDCAAEGATCSVEAYCGEGTCRVRVANGAPCGPDDRCLLGAGCVGGICTGPTFVASGQACGADRRCPYLTSCRGGTCQPTAALSGPCASPAECDSGLCEGGLCVAPRADGQPCTAAHECASGRCEAQACAPLPSACFTR